MDGGPFCVWELPHQLVGAGFELGGHWSHTGVDPANVSRQTRFQTRFQTVEPLHVMCSMEGRVACTVPQLARFEFQGPQPLIGNNRHSLSSHACIGVVAISVINVR